MTLLAFSAIIASYVPNHGNLGPSGSYNAWVNKINMRKNACNSGATCTNTPDDIYDVKFIECDKGCSAKGNDKCNIIFCDALADVYDYTRRLESSDVVESDGRALSTVDWRPSKWQSKSLSAPYNQWVDTVRLALVFNQALALDTKLDKPFPGCSEGCVSAGSVCSVGSNFCAALAAVVLDWDTDRTEYEPEDTPFKELTETYSAGVPMTQNLADYVMCSLDEGDEHTLEHIARAWPADVSCTLPDSCEGPWSLAKTLL